MPRVGRRMKRRASSGGPEQDATWKVALKILRYLNKNPHAADTVNGILEWWLLKQSIREEQRVVEHALRILEERHLILSATSADGRKHYYLNADRIAESRRLIGEAEDSETQNHKNQD
jgi:hypothetical protein